MTITQLDLANWPARRVDLPENYRRSAHEASRRSARRRVAASPDLNGRRDGIEVRFEHRLVSITIRCIWREDLESYYCARLTSVAINPLG